MNKKQAGVILALLALIVCAGVLAAKVNSSMQDLGTVSITDSGDDAANINNSKQDEIGYDFFYEAKSVRDKKSAETLEYLAEIIDSENVSQMDRDTAAKQKMALVMDQENETKIELALKGKGFEEILCLIENDKARIFVKNASELTESQRKQIQEVVMSVAKIKNVEIELKK
ncbi:hypothetical protein SFBM_0968 [Candidatus Arthromitus sp. SFB-mouse-Japan]|uniref:SpoIIIAH-like family protein n=1 Tax=unclassified Candidatus Neoarthromitus TaxID=2638829 RepID=UPI00021B7FDA|nr:MULTISPECIES: SpoIIIAH-like family protein [unclassified Candidatus Arthromitus]EIA24541.1 Putative stage III sporulation protein AH [Candidatus Arthromitus sp. SFB-1]EIA25859.1 Putative stage III sporulation protein AH [Candidatus Arthromitus sp. SFB-3]EIA27977.1 Putative stage III sporulation protein AH [Candidatus Arthromitus sp. SFB-4]EIA28783.1 Putative stage III sporulation protein AH [Candidatus Arthromitus sp. SFB-co]EIA31005.1 Putative stage III sporulation protein AH [Candidatus A